jgi:hypothetical protein
MVRFKSQTIVSGLAASLGISLKNYVLLLNDTFFVKHGLHMALTLIKGFDLHHSRGASVDHPQR